MEVLARIGKEKGRMLAWQERWGGINVASSIHGAHFCSPLAAILRLLVDVRSLDRHARHGAGRSLPLSGDCRGLSSDLHLQVRSETLGTRSR